MIVRRESTIIDYHGPFDQALRSFLNSRKIFWASVAVPQKPFKTQQAGKIVIFLF